MNSALDLCVAWAIMGVFMCQTFWPRPALPSSDQANNTSVITWPKKAHPQALTENGKLSTPWLTSWAKPTFEQGCLSILPHLEGPCRVASLPGEHLFQASKIQRDRMRPVIFHAFGKAKAGAQDALRVGNAPNSHPRYAAPSIGMVP